MNNKNVKLFAKNNNLAIDNKGRLVYGTFGGRFLAIWENVPKNQNNHVVRIWAKPSEAMDEQAITNFVQGLPGKHEFLKTVTYDGSVITAQFVCSAGFGKAKNYMSAMEGFINQITGFCAAYNLPISCEGCEFTEDVALYQINEMPHLLCANCLAQLVQKAAINKAEYNKKGQGNVLGGIVGALLGSLLGVLAWVIIYQLGYISVISGVIMAMCALKGYELFGGRVTKLSIVLCTILSAVMLIFAEQICLAIDLCNAYPGEVGFFEAFRIVPYFVMEYASDFAGVFADVAIGLVCVVGSAIAIGVQTYKEKTGAIASRLIAKINLR